MMLLLLPLAGLLLGGEALDNFAYRPSRPIVFMVPTTRYPGVIRITNKVRTNLDGQGLRRPFLPQRPTRLVPGRLPVLVPPQSHNMDTDHSGFGPTRRPSTNFVPSNFDSHQSPSSVNQGQIPSSFAPTRRPSDFVSSNFDNHQSSSDVNQGKKPSSSGHTPRPSAVNYRPSNFDEVQNPSTFNQDHDEQHRPSGSAKDPNAPSFVPSHEPSSYEERNPSSINPDFKPSSFEDSNKSSSFENGHKPSTSVEDRRLSSFGQDQKPFDQDRKASFPDKYGPHPDRSPVCNVRPDPGTCRAALPRYYYDPETGTCNCFLYGGCREDGKAESPGSFFTLGECQQECVPPKLEEGPVCKEIFKEDQFISYLVEPLPQNTKTDHLNDEELLASFYK